MYINIDDRCKRLFGIWKCLFFMIFIMKCCDMLYNLFRVGIIDYVCGNFVNYMI